MKKLLVLYVMVLVMLAVGPVPAAAAGASIPSGSQAQAPVNLNQATANQLIALPGVGKVTAEKIIAYRTEQGPFTAVDDLLRVKGIGPKKLEKLRPLVAVR